MKKKLTKSIVSAILLLNLSAQAQVSAYAFTQRLGTYVPITTGTVFGSSTSDQELFVDPAVPLGGTVTSGVGLPIGFTFTYNGMPCDVIGISNNGWIGLGQSTLTPAVNIHSSIFLDSYYVIAGGTNASPTHQQRIGGLSMNLAAQSGSKIRMATIGTAPNRTCVVQWSNYKKISLIGTTSGLGDSFEFQIRLLETSNAVEVVYGSFSNSFDLFSTTCQVGLRGAINTDFNSRGIIPLTPDPVPWLTSITFTTSGLSGYIADNLTPYLPVKGLTYRWLPPSPCTTPTNVTAVTPQTLACSNGSFSVEVDNYSTYTNPNTYTYQWYSSTVSAVGPFSPVTSATAAAIPVNNPSVTTWYQAEVTCSITLGTATTNAVALQIAAGTTTSSVPYNEGFEDVMRNNDLPNCSWATTSPTNCLTFTSHIGNNNRFSNSGNKFATFRGAASSTGDYFYSNGIQLEPGVTYSAGVRYITSGVGNWPEFSLMLGNIPAASSMSNIASVFNTNNPLSYSLLSNTFTVAASGIYYLGIKCSAGISALQFLSFDDLFVTAPCSLNTPAVSISANNYTVCSGKSTTLTATGATSYNWGNATGSTYVVSPQASATYSVIGTNSLSGCTNSTSINIIVNSTPLAAIIAQAPSVCPGASVTLHASGNGLFSWNNGLTAPSIVVSPSVNTTYTLTVLSPQGGCVNSATLAIGVYTPAPLFAQANNEAICLGETVQLTGSGNGIVSFEWRSNNITIHSKVASVSPLTSTTYSLIGTDGNGCTSTQTLQLLVKVCTGITENAGNSKLLVFPNPTSGRLTISTGNALIKNIVVTDITGRLITTMSSDTEAIELNLEGLANGIYYAKITSGKENSMMKIVKD